MMHISRPLPPLIALAIGALLALAPASAIAHVSLVLQEGPEAHLLEAGSGFSLYTFAPITLEARSGSIECPYNVNTADGILRGEDQTNNANRDKVIFTSGLGSLGAKVQCASTIPGFPGPAAMFVADLPWTGTLTTGGHIDVKGTPLVDFYVYSFEGPSCNLTTANLKGTFSPSLEASFSGKLKLQPGEGSAGCPRTVTIHLSFQEANSTDGREAAHRIAALVRR
jgi:hypothetical protein